MMTKLLLATILVSLLTACATKLVPIQVNASTIRVKIENPKAGKPYTLLSNTNEGVIDQKFPSKDGVIDFNMSRSKQIIGKCFFVSDDEKLIPIKNSISSFTNPSFNSYLAGHQRLAENQRLLKQEQALLVGSYSYRNGACALLTTKDIPEQPAEACSPREEGEFSAQACKNFYTEPSVVRNIARSVLSGIGGLVTGVVAGPVVGFITGVGIDQILSDTGKEMEYNECFTTTRTSCRYHYANWLPVATEIQNNPAGLHQQCVKSTQNIATLETSRETLNKNINLAVQSWVPITESEYCR